MINKDTLNKILWATIEDYVGLWEIVWELNTIFPDNLEVENRKIAEKIIKYFFEQNLIKFYKSKWGVPNDNFKEVNFANIDDFLATEENWAPPASSEEYISLSNTQKGKEFYDQGKLTDLN